MVRLPIFLVLIAAAFALNSAPVKDDTPVTELPRSGTICVLPNSPKPPERISPGEEYNPSTLSVKVDKSQPIPWPHKQVVKLENLDLKGRHLLVLTSDGRRIQSLWFRFSDFKEVNLCLAFEGYQGVQLADKRSSFWCRCR